MCFYLSLYTKDKTDSSRMTKLGLFGGSDIAFLTATCLKRHDLYTGLCNRGISVSVMKISTNSERNPDRLFDYHNGSRRPTRTTRRDILKITLLPLASVALRTRPSKATENGHGITQSATDIEKALKDFREVTGLQDLAFEYTNRFEFDKAEILWTKIISLNEDNAAAFSNRGNCRTSQGKFNEAVSDFDRAITLAPDEPDPYLGKGVALEGLRAFKHALEAYEKANEKSLRKYKTADAIALNNMGNAYGALGEWDDAFKFYKKAADMDSHFIFALANEALAMFQIGDDQAALRKMRFLTRKYPRFGDMHAAIAMALWDEGKRPAAEDSWYKAVSCDNRYEDVSWVRDIRRWPPRLLRILESFRAIA